MNIVRYPTDRLERLLRDQQVATMPQLKSALGTSVTFTVLRKLAPLGYRSSYSHCGTYYTLDSIAQYDERGLWAYRDIHFSRHGTLLNTAATLVTNAPAGYFTDELDAVVHVATKDALRHLVQQDRLYRRELTGRYLYCAKERQHRQEQWAARQAQQRSQLVQDFWRFFSARGRPPPTRRTRSCSTWPLNNSARPRATVSTSRPNNWAIR